MKRRINPWVALLTAALTFGSLMAFVGPRSFGHHRGHWSHEYSYHRGFGSYRDNACEDHDLHSRRLAPGSDSTGIR